MVVLNKKGFKLPFLETEKYRLIMRLGLNYDKAQRLYSVSNHNNIEKLSVEIASILGVDEVVFTQTCILCNKDFPCSDCKYIELCATKNMPFPCVCSQCLKEGRTFPES
jgi:hypothetical protein